MTQPANPLSASEPWNLVADGFAEVQQLAHWPECTGDIKRLQGRDGYRLRIGDHRVIFEIDQSGNPIIVTIMQVEKRNERTY